MARVARRRVLTGTLLALVAGCVSAVGVAQAAPRMHFNIPATRLDQALLAYSRQSGYRLLFPFEAAERRRVRPVVGEFTPKEALDQLLTGSELTVASRASGVIILRKSPPPQDQSRPAPQNEVAKDSHRPVELSELLVIAGSQDAAPLAIDPDPATTIAAISQLDQEAIGTTARASTGDLFRALAGFQTVDFGQAQVANGLALRGWTAINDGQDLAVFVDGRPVNLVSGANSNGYLDLNPVIPELVSRSVVVRGPMDLRYGGNLAIGGAVVTETRARVATGLAVSGGNFGQARALATLAADDDANPGYLALDLQRLDGYRDNDDGFSVNLVARSALPVTQGEASLSVQLYGTRFSKPSYLRLSSLQSGEATTTSAIDTSDFGRKREVNSVFHYRLGQDEAQLDLHLYADVGHISSATSFGGRPRSVDPSYPQYINDDRRVTLGGDVELFRRFDLAGRPAGVRLGVVARADHVDSDRAPGFGGRAIRTPDPLDSLYFGRARFWQLNPAVYAGLEVKPTAKVRLTAGLRYEGYGYRIDATRYDAVTGAFAQNALRVQRGLTLLKFGAAVQVTQSLSATAAFGQSARSPSAVMDLPVNPALRVSRLGSYEAGLAYVRSDGAMRARLGVYETRLSNEVGYASFTPSNYGRSRRRGLDAEAAVRLVETGAARADLTFGFNVVKARLLNNDRGPYVPNVADWIGGLGLAVSLPVSPSGSSWTLNLQHQRVGPQPLTAAGDVRAPAYDRLAFKALYRNPRWASASFWTSLIAYPGERLSEATYFARGGRFVAPSAPLRVDLGVSREF